MLTHIYLSVFLCVCISVPVIVYLWRNGQVSTLQGWESPGGPVDCVLSLPRVWVQALVGELRSHKPCSAARTKNKKQKICSADQQERAVWGCSTHAEFFFSHGNVSLAVSPQLCQGIVDELKLYVFEVYSVMVCYMGTL